MGTMRDRVGLEKEKLFCDEFHLVDLRVNENSLIVTKDVDHVFNLTADMGGMGFIQSNHSAIMHNYTMISFNMLEAARINSVKSHKTPMVWRSCVPTSCASTTPLGLWNAMQNCPLPQYLWSVQEVEGLTKSDYSEPVNLGSDEMVSMNEMAEIVLSFEGKKMPIKHIPGPEGVRGDNPLIKEKLGWEPSMKSKIHLEFEIDPSNFIKKKSVPNSFVTALLGSDNEDLRAQGG